jgi:putative ABC transport system permease protein
MNALNKKAIKDITLRKLRTLLTVLGIAVGVMGLSAINIASGQFSSSLQYSIDASAQPDIEFATAPTSPAPVLEALQQQPNVEFVEGRSDLPARWKIPAGSYPLIITGLTDLHHVQFNTFELTSGSLPGPHQIALEASDQAIANLHVGSQIEVTVRGEPQELTVSGFVRTRGLPSATILGEAFGYMHLEDVQALFQTSGVNDFLIRLHDYNQRTQTAEQLARVLQARQVVVLAASIGHSDHHDQTIVNGLFGIMQALSVIALLLSLFLLLSTITTLITEQLQVIGTMKAIGAGRRQIMRSYLTSVTIYGVIGTAIGLGLGIPGSYLLVSFFGTLLTLDIGPLVVSPLVILLSIAVGVGVPLLATALPVYFGTRITVHQALSGYGLESAGRSGRGRSSATLRAFGWIPQTFQLGARSLFRKRTRAMLTLMALIISAAAFLCVQTTTASFNTLLNQILGTYHADMFVNLANPQPYSKIQQELASVPGIAGSEPLFQDLVHTEWGDGVLTGVEPDAHLYQKQVVSGRWFTASDHDVVVISTDAAEKSGLKVGESIAVHTSLYSARWRIIGVAQDYNNGPGEFGVLLSPVEQVTAFEHLPAGFTQSVMVLSASRGQADIDALAARIDDTLSKNGIQADVETARHQAEQIEGQFQIIYALLYSVTAIIALVGAIGLFNALAMSVLERRREIGILRSMGATGRKVAQVFWTEGITLGVIAWLIALAIGLPGAYGFVLLLGQLLLPVPFAFDPLSLVIMLGFLLLVATAASVGPVWGATRVRIAQTLRYE